ncbi:hypothetical protein GCM10011613_30340 [Cellvibrio zantedeschiae]|uniref:Lipoprotein n=1 Tax=Cellvibrio zantedeschiae TaxID=1237077 RepID=A0ABQ3BBS9_9GAMM|nr:hypothetical protein [Cellvibrio zantedeschiae]GGY83382.1 hypothetical protein GCM10011613_30340 [Cellvibrio zantedeschiae]
MLNFPKDSFNFIVFTSLVLSGCTPSAYMQPVTGDLSTIKFELPQGDKKITIYEKPEQCAGPTFVPMMKDETFKEVKVKQGEKVSFTVDYVLERQRDKKLFVNKACQITYTLNATDKDYHLKYVIYSGGVCNLEAQRLAGAQRVREPDMFQREYILSSKGSLTASHCKPQKKSEESVVEQPQSKKAPEEITVEQFQPKIYPMQVKGVVFSIDMPLIEGEDLQHQQDRIFTLSNEDTENKSMRKYVKAQKALDEKSTYILRSGMSIPHPKHLFDTFLEYKISANCQPQKKYLHCEYKAVDGFYSRDLPPSVSLDGNQTVEQMEASEISTLSLLNTRPVIQKETFNSGLSLEKLQPILRKNNFSVKSKGSRLSLYRAKFNYNAELTQKKAKSGYVITASVEVDPQKRSAYYSDFVTPFNQIINDIKASAQ